MKLVSVIAATQDEELTLEESINSILSQSYKNIEVIIVDDGSVDNTPVIAKRFLKKDKRVKYFRIRRVEDAGCVRPRIYAINKSRGDFLFIIDTDAKYSKDYVKKGVSYLEKHKDCGGVSGKLIVWDTSTWVTKCLYVNYALNDDAGLVQKRMREGRASVWLMPRRVYEGVGGYNIRMRYAEDLDLVKRIVKKYDVKFMPKVLWYHRYEPDFWKTMRLKFVYGKRVVSYFRKGQGLVELFKRFVKGFWPLYLLVFFYNVWIGLFLSIVFLPVIFSKHVRKFFDARAKKIRFAPYVLLAPFLMTAGYVSEFFGILYGFFKK